MKISPIHPRQHSFLAQCHLKIGEAEQALAQLTHIPADDPVYGEERLWLMAMANLALKEPDRVRLILNQLLDSNFYKTKAAEIIDKLDVL